MEKYFQEKEFQKSQEEIWKNDLLKKFYDNYVFIYHSKSIG